MPTSLEAALNGKKSEKESYKKCNSDVICKGLPLKKSLLFGTIEKTKNILKNEHRIKLSSNGDWIHKCREIVDVCIKRNLDVNLSETNRYSTLLHFVLENLYDDFESVITRVTNFDINARNNGFRRDKKTLLHMAVENGRKNVVKILLEFGADVNVQDYCRQTPLYYAVCSTQMEVAEMLLKAGANVNAKTTWGEMPIHRAFGQRGSNYSFNYGQKLPSWELIELLCAYGAELDFNHPSGTKALCDACSGGSLKEVQFLLKHGANILPRDRHEYSPLHHAVFGNSIIFVDYLLSNGADLKAISVDEDSPILKLAEIGEDFNFTAFDINPKKRPTAIVYSDCPQGDLENIIQLFKMAANMIEYLADNGANVNVKGSDYRSPLDLAISLNSLEIVECLLELNAEIDNSLMNNKYFFYYYGYVTQNSNLHADRIDTCVLLTAFIAMRKDDISQYIDGRHKLKWVLPFFAKCKSEVNRMKSGTICENRSVTFFDFLIQDLMKVLRFCRSEEIMSVLECGKHKQAYPSYNYLFERRMERVKRLRICEENFILYVEMHFKQSLPLLVIEGIFSYLSASDLRNFGRALYSLKDCPERNPLQVKYVP